MQYQHRSIKAEETQLERVLFRPCRQDRIPRLLEETNKAYNAEFLQTNPGRARRECA